MSLSGEKLWKAGISGNCSRALFRRSETWIARRRSRHGFTRMPRIKTFQTPIIRHARPQRSNATVSNLHGFHTATAKTAWFLFSLRSLRSWWFTGDCLNKVSGDALARISHKASTAAAQRAMSTALRSLKLLGVLSSTPAGFSVARLVSTALCTASLQNPVRNAG
jgi:hypothetical protein